ncbi:MAG: helix-turn-helix transcriptional regulator [Ruminococcaceae bacterium]|nr:helix-turn-helix transcriptional regulator [Oscillospiraceae bacterium]
MSPFGKRLQAAIERSEKTAAEIEEKLGFEPGSIEKWINDDLPPDTPTVNALSAELGVSSNALLFGVERLGEIKAMFPNDKTAAPSPFGTWPFVTGLIMIFTGFAGALLLFMRVMGVGYEGSIFEAMGVSLIVLGAVAVTGLVMCIWVACKGLRVSEKSKKKDGEK